MSDTGKVSNRFMFVSDYALRGALRDWNEVIATFSKTLSDMVVQTARNEVQVIERELKIRTAYDEITEQQIDAFRAIQDALDGDFSGTVDMLVSMGASWEQGQAWERIFGGGRTS